MDDSLLNIIIRAFAILGVFYVAMLAKGAWEILRERKSNNDKS